MGKVFRGILAVVLGIVASAVVTLVVEAAGHHVFPPPPGIDMHDHAAMAEAMMSMPFGALAGVLVAWAAGTFAGSWVAARIAPGAKIAFGLGVGALFLAAGVALMLTIPHPIWMWVLGLAEFLPAAYLGARLAAPRPRPVPSSM